MGQIVRTGRLPHKYIYKKIKENNWFGKRQHDCTDMSFENGGYSGERVLAYQSIWD